MVYPDIAIIINSFNRLSLLRECLESISSWLPYTEFKNRCAFIIYEAGSTDGSIEWLNNISLKQNLLIEIFIPNENMDTSFAAGINAGVSYAKKKYPLLNYLLFYETDNQILNSEPLIQALACLKSNRRLGACGFTVRKLNGKPAGTGQPFPTLLNFVLGKNMVNHFKLEAIRYNWFISKSGVEFSEVDVVYTSPLLVKIAAWEETNGLDADNFPFSDCDVDWARRLRTLNWKMGVIKSDSVIHDNKGMISSWSKSRVLQSHKARLRYFKRYYPNYVFLVWPVLLIVRHLLELVGTIFITKPMRRRQLSTQFYTLLKSSIKGYQ